MEKREDLRREQYLSAYVAYYKKLQGYCRPYLLEALKDTAKEVAFFDILAQCYEDIFDETEVDTFCNINRQNLIKVFDIIRQQNYVEQWKDEFIFNDTFVEIKDTPIYLPFEANQVISAAHIIFLLHPEMKYSSGFNRYAEKGKTLNDRIKAKGGYLDQFIKYLDFDIAAHYNETDYREFFDVYGYILYGNYYYNLQNKNDMDKLEENRRLKKTNPLKKPLKGENLLKILITKGTDVHYIDLTMPIKDYDRSILLLNTIILEKIGLKKYIEFSEYRKLFRMMDFNFEWDIEWLFFECSRNKDKMSYDNLLAAYLTLQDLDVSFEVQKSHQDCCFNIYEAVYWKIFAQEEKVYHKIVTAMNVEILTAFNEEQRKIYNKLARYNEININAYKQFINEKLEELFAFFGIDDKKKLCKLGRISKKVWLYMHSNDFNFNLTSIDSHPKDLDKQPDLYTDKKIAASKFLIMMVLISKSDKIDASNLWYGKASKDKNKTLYQMLDNIRKYYSNDFISRIQRLQRLILLSMELTDDEIALMKKYNEVLWEKQCNIKRNFQSLDEVENHLLNLHSVLDNIIKNLTGTTLIDKIQFLKIAKSCNDNCIICDKQFSGTWCDKWDKDVGNYIKERFPEFLWKY